MGPGLLTSDPLIRLRGFAASTFAPGASVDKTARPDLRSGPRTFEPSNL